MSELAVVAEGEEDTETLMGVGADADMGRAMVVGPDAVAEAGGAETHMGVGTEEESRAAVLMAVE